MSERRKAPDWGNTKREPTPTAKPKAFRVIPASEVEPEEVHWLWYPYIPAGKLTVLEGDPGMGKSWISCAISATVSRGDNLPGQKYPLPAQKVLIASAEDGLSDTIVPRLKTLDGDLSKIYCLPDGFVLNKEGIGRLEETMRTFAATIVFIDPIVAYLGGKVDMHRANEVREVMGELHKSAERTGCAIIVVRHLRKAGGGKAIYAGIGSIDFSAAARSVLAVDYTKTGQKVMRHIKSNNAKKGLPIAYETEEGEDLGGNRWSVGRFHWKGFADEDDLEEIVVSKTPRAKAEAEAFLRNFLSSGPRLSQDVLDAAAAVKISPRTLNRAKQGLVRSYKEADRWYWELTEPPIAAPSPGEKELAALVATAVSRSRALGAENG